MARYLITGIAGFIGSSLAHELVDNGHEVRGIDNLSTGTLKNLEGFRSPIDVEIGDIQDVALMNAVCKEIDCILHHAALTSVPCSVEDPLTSHNANVNGTLSVLMAARRAGVKRIVYSSSSSVYGDQPLQPKHEDMCPEPLSPYAVQKLAGEHYVKSFCREYGLQGVCLRYFNIFGPKQAAGSPYSGVVAQFICKMMAGETPTINGDGNTSRDFTFVTNAIQANLLACTATDNIADGRVFNVGTGYSCTLNELYSSLAEMIGFHKPPRYGPARAADIRHSRASLDRSRNELGYVPTEDFLSGLEKTVTWYQQFAKSGSS